ncbi:lysozyme isoform X2 [Papilio machaon]|uniref:lysozyme isoform X2 n=1 Tax=Papilio machaon TaxID=76193 RepID=UPI001E665821|nr:lysozyme isoform X2 [Papilio machaon]
MNKFHIFVLFTFLIYVEGIKFTRCRLATALQRTKLIEKTFLGNWVCLIEKVSNRDTRAMVVTPSGRKFYGLYQIPSRWCREGKKGGECNITCEALLDDDILDDTACAMDIFHKEGFKYWTQWTIRCKNDNLITNEIYKCPDLLGKKPQSELFWNRMKRVIARSTTNQSTPDDYYTFYWIN